MCTKMRCRFSLIRQMFIMHLLCVLHTRERTVNEMHSSSFLHTTYILLEERQAVIDKGIHKLRVYQMMTSAVEESEAREGGKGAPAGREGLPDGETSGQRGACECGCVGNESLLGRGTKQCKGPEGEWVW